MNKPFGVCLQPVLPLSTIAYAKEIGKPNEVIERPEQPEIFLHRSKEKVGCKRGIEISISFFKQSESLIVLRLQAQTNKK